MAAVKAKMIGKRATAANEMENDEAPAKKAKFTEKKANQPSKEQKEQTTAVNEVEADEAPAKKVKSPEKKANQPRKEKKEETTDIKKKLRSRAKK